MEERHGQDAWEVEAQNLVSQVGRDVEEPRGEEARGVDTGGSRQAALEKGLEASSQHPRPLQLSHSGCFPCTVTFVRPTKWGPCTLGRQKASACVPGTGMLGRRSPTPALTTERVRVAGPWAGARTCSCRRRCRRCAPGGASGNCRVSQTRPGAHAGRSELAPCQWVLCTVPASLPGEGSWSTGELGKESSPWVPFQDLV